MCRAMPAWRFFYPHRAGLAPGLRVLVDLLLESFAADPCLQKPAPRQRKA
jgi:hypothetical protein